MYDPYMEQRCHPAEGVKVEPLDPALHLMTTQAYQLGRSQQESMELSQKLREATKKIESLTQDLDSAKYYRDRNETRASEWQETAHKLQKQVDRLKPKKKVTKKGKK